MYHGVRGFNYHNGLSNGLRIPWGPIVSVYMNIVDLGGIWKMYAEFSYITWQNPPFITKKCFQWVSLLLEEVALIKKGTEDMPDLLSKGKVVNSHSNSLWPGEKVHMWLNTKHARQKSQDCMIKDNKKPFLTIKNNFQRNFSAANDLLRHFWSPHRIKPNIPFLRRTHIDLI